MAPGENEFDTPALDDALENLNLKEGNKGNERPPHPL